MDMSTHTPYETMSLKSEPQRHLVSDIYSLLCADHDPNSKPQMGTRVGIRTFQTTKGRKSSLTSTRAQLMSQHKKTATKSFPDGTGPHSEYTNSPPQSYPSAGDATKNCARFYIYIVGMSFNPTFLGGSPQTRLQNLHPSTGLLPSRIITTSFIHPSQNLTTFIPWPCILSM